jgi:uncharacterized membrane protein
MDDFLAPLIGLVLAAVSGALVGLLIGFAL